MRNMKILQQREQPCESNYRIVTSFATWENDNLTILAEYIL